MLAEVVYALILKTNGIKHTRGGFCHTRVRITLPWMECRPLDKYSSEAVQIDEVFIFGAVPKRT